MAMHAAPAPLMPLVALVALVLLALLALVLLHPHNLMPPAPLLPHTATAHLEHVGQVLALCAVLLRVLERRAAEAQQRRHEETVDPGRYVADGQLTEQHLRRLARLDRGARLFRDEDVDEDADERDGAKRGAARVYIFGDLFYDTLVAAREGVRPHELLLEEWGRRAGAGGALCRV
jgi:hypothetical protein